MNTSGYAYAEPNSGFNQIEYDLGQPGPGEAIVKIAGCGLCHTDVSFYTGSVPPRSELPLVLGHEISGVVEEAGTECAGLKGKQVIVPAVMPCGDCPLCNAGYHNSCKGQFMPGNDGHGGFARHIKVPARFLAQLPDDLGEYELAELSVIADAVTTPYQSAIRSGLKEGDVAIVIGTGGIGTYGVQVAAAFGATVIALDIDEAKLSRISEYGAAHTFNCAGKDARAAKGGVKEIVKGAGLPTFGWKIFEMSGTAAGQELAFNLVPPSGTLGIVGFTMDKVTVRLSNLMALDATCFGNWGCAPKYYGPSIDLVLQNKITLKPFIKTHPLDQIGELFGLAHEGKLAERAILIPN